MGVLICFGGEEILLIVVRKFFVGVKKCFVGEDKTDAGG